MKTAYCPPTLHNIHGTGGVGVGIQREEEWIEES